MHQLVSSMYMPALHHKGLVESLLKKVGNKHAHTYMYMLHLGYNVHVHVQFKAYVKAVHMGAHVAYIQYIQSLALVVSHTFGINK